MEWLELKKIKSIDGLGKIKFDYLKIKKIEFVSEIILTIFSRAIISNKDRTIANVGITWRRDHFIVHSIGEITIFRSIDGRIFQMPISTNDRGE